MNHPHFCRTPIGLAKSLAACLTMLSVLIACGADPNRALGQQAPPHHRSTTDDGNSDSQSYPFDSGYDGQMHQPARIAWQNRAERGRAMGVQLEATDEGQVFLRSVRRGDPADRAGLRPGDTILAIDGYEIGSLAEARRALRRHPAGEDLEFVILRDGRTREFDVPVSDFWRHPVEAVVAGTEEAASRIGSAAERLGSDVRQLSHAWQRELRAAAGERPRASVREPFDRFSYDPLGEETDIDDESADDSGEPQMVIKIDVIPPDQVDDRAPRDQPRLERPRPLRPASPPSTPRKQPGPERSDRVDL